MPDRPLLLTGRAPMAAMFLCIMSACSVAQDEQPPEPPGAAPKAAAERRADEKAQELETILGCMETARKKLKMVRAKVVLRRHIAALDVDETWKGELAFKTPRLLRLKLVDTETKHEKLYVVGEKEAWIYSPDWEQAERFSLASLKERDKSTANPLQYGLAADVAEIRKAFDISYEGSEKIGDSETCKLKMLPKEEDSDIAYAKLILWVDKTLWLPVQVEQHRSDGEIIETYTLCDVKLNKRIRARTFKFKPPRGTAIMEYER